MGTVREVDPKTDYDGTCTDLGMLLCLVKAAAIKNPILYNYINVNCPKQVYQ